MTETDTLAHHLVAFEITNSGYEYVHYLLLPPMSIDRAEERAIDIAKHFYGDDDEPGDYNNHCGWFEFNGGEVVVKISEIMSVSEAEFNVLSKFLGQD